MGMRTVEEEQDIIDITDTAVDVTDQVAAEKAERANKTEIKMDIDGGDAGTDANEAPQCANDAPAGQSPTTTPETPSEAPETRSPGF